jgi:hypothetical protein
VFASHAVEASLSAESLAFDTGADGPVKRVRYTGDLGLVLLVLNFHGVRYL